jgi:hypothetical protein
MTLLPMLLCLAALQTSPEATPPPPAVEPAAPAPVRWPELHLSDKLLELRVEGWSALSLGPLTGFEVVRGGHSVMSSSFTTGLDALVHSSPQAEAMAREAHGDAVLGTGLVFAGVTLVVLSSVAMVIIAAKASDPSPGIFVPVGVDLGAVVLALVGQAYTHAALKEALEAISFYNEDLVEGRLRE